jgi:hypothetical protein
MAIKLENWRSRNNLTFWTLVMDHPLNHKLLCDFIYKINILDKPRFYFLIWMSLQRFYADSEFMTHFWFAEEFRHMSWVLVEYWLWFGYWLINFLGIWVRVLVWIVSKSIRNFEKYYFFSFWVRAKVLVLKTF